MKSIKKIKSHFQKEDKRIYKIMSGMNLELLKQPKSSKNYFLKLCREIIGQQLANKAAHAILNRFFLKFSDKNITPEKVFSLSEKELRDVGMSWAKARYIRDLAEQTKNKSINFTNLHKLSDEEVIKELTKVKGIGKWTSEMFLIFTLGREDVFSFGDYGLRRAIQELYNLKKKPTDKQVEKIVSKWSPYKSYGSLALWESLDNG